MNAMEPQCTRSLPRRGVRTSFDYCSNWERTPMSLLLLLLLRSRTRPWRAPVMKTTTTTGSTRRNSPSTRDYLVRPWQVTWSVCRSWSTKLEFRSMSAILVVELPPCSMLWAKDMSKSSNSYCQEAPHSSPARDSRTVSLALRVGNADVTKAILESEQWKASGADIDLGHLPYAGQGDNIEMAQLVISSCGIPPPTGSLGHLTAPQQKAMLDAIATAISYGAINCLDLLLSYATRQRPDGSYEYFRGDEFYKTLCFNLLEKTIEMSDDPQLFQIVWETIICHPDAGPSDPFSPSLQSDGTPCPTKDEAIHRFLIDTAHHGRVETMKLIHEHYGADVNHISHPFSLTCLGRSAGAVKHDMTSRLAVVRYLLENTNPDLTIAQGHFANGMTPLFLTVTQRQPELVKLLLEFGGPVERVEGSIYTYVESIESGMVKVCVACHEKQPRCPVEIWTPQGFAKTPNSDQVTHLDMEWERDELLRVLDGLQSRRSNEELLRTDPKGRPLAKAARS
jgi:hypothetical protein